MFFNTKTNSLGMDPPGLVVDKLTEEIKAFGKSFLSKT